MLFAVYFLLCASGLQPQILLLPACFQQIHQHWSSGHGKGFRNVN